MGRATTLLVASAVTAGLLAGCGEDSTSSSEPTFTPSSVSRADKLLAPYDGGPSPFPALESLRRLPRGAEAVYVSCAAPECQALAKGLEPALTMLGIKLTIVPAGRSAQDIASAFNSAVARKPDIVFAPGMDPALWSDALEQFRNEGIPVIGLAIGKKADGIEADIQGLEISGLMARLAAAYVYSKSGNRSHVIQYTPAPVPATAIPAGAAFEGELKALCPDCEVETRKVASDTVGTKLPNMVVSDVQRNPDTKWVVFHDGSASNGVGQALRAAGIDGVKVVNRATNPENYEDLKNGDVAVSVAVTLPISVWLAADMAARLLADQPIPAHEQGGKNAPMQVMVPKDVTFDPAEGWNPYPDFPQRFADAWKVAGN
jgi:ABC-type sugar transport system substrate-binding protein